MLDEGLDGGCCVEEGRMKEQLEVGAMNEHINRQEPHEGMKKRMEVVHVKYDTDITSRTTMHHPCTTHAPPMHYTCSTHAPPMHYTCTTHALHMHHPCTTMHHPCFTHAPPCTTHASPLAVETRGSGRLLLFEWKHLPELKSSWEILLNT